VSRGVHLPVILEPVEITRVAATATAVSGIRACVASSPATCLIAVLWCAAPTVAASVSAAVAGISAATATVRVVAGISAATARVRIAPGVSAATTSIRIASGIAASSVRIAAGVSASAASIGITTPVSAASAGVGIAARISAPTTDVGVACAPARAAAWVCRAGIGGSSTTAAASALRIKVDGRARRSQGKSPDQRRQVRQSAGHPIHPFVLPDDFAW
jgi:hypothetical protein